MALALERDETLELLEFAKTMVKEDRRAEAVDLCRRVLAAKSDIGARWGEVAQLLRQLGDDDAAVRAGRYYVDDDPRDASRLGLLAELLSAVDEIGDALKIIEALAAQHPNVAGAQYGAGYFSAQKGDFDKARGFYRKALELQPDFVACWEQLVRLKRFTAGDADYQTLRKLVAQSERMRPELRMALSYALGKACEDAGDYDEAFGHITNGAALMHSLSPFQIEAYEAYCERLKDTFSPDVLDPLAEKGGNPSDRPIFIVGMPRSGATLVEQILASHGDVQGGGELKYLRLATLQLKNLEAKDLVSFLKTTSGQNTPAPDPVENPWAAMGGNYLSFLESRFGSNGRVTDKNLGNHVLIGVLQLILPNAKIVYCTRDPIDTAWSCFKTRFEKGNLWSYDFDSLARYSRGYASLMDHWRGLRPDAIHEIRYEDLVSNPERETEKMLGFCGLKADANCLRFNENDRVISTESMAQVRQPIYQSSVGASENYGDHFKPLVEALSAQGLLKVR
ncbi:MAG: sulfotransferase [Sphingomonadales bacterium]